MTDTVENFKLNIILFCNRPTQKDDANTIIDHIDAFSKYSQHNIYCFSNHTTYPSNLDLSRFDALIIHYSSYLLNNFYIPPAGKKQIQEFKGLKILFLQDEYRRIYDFHRQIQQLGIHILFTCFPEKEIEKVYPTYVLPDLVKINNLTGYVPEALLKFNPPPIADRPIDVGYRSRKLAYWYGQLATEKWRIVDGFLKHTQDSGLKCDLSYHENQRIYGQNWLNFIQQCKTMLGTESGASVMDFTGYIERNVENYQAKHPHCTFEEVQEKFLKGHDGNIAMNQISPRCFEAIALKTPLVLFEGSYSDILIPEHHYIPLKKDFSNIFDVIRKIKDCDYLQELANRAYQEIALNNAHSYKNFIEKFDRLINNTFLEKKFSCGNNAYTMEVFLKEARKLALRAKIKKSSLMHAKKFFRKLPTKMQYHIKRYIGLYK